MKTEIATTLNYRQVMKTLFGTRVREARTRNQITLKQLSQETGLRIATLSGIERGKHQARAESIVKICKALKISSDHLLGVWEQDRNELPRITQD